MTHKIYLIRHLDTGKGYVGVTKEDLSKRWYQHMHDPASAVYKALRSDGHRMTMEIIEEIESRQEALIREQEYIHAMGTAQPNGWNRNVRPIKIQKPKVWQRIEGNDLYLERGMSALKCPVCGDFYTDQTNYEKVERSRGDGVRIYFKCVNCHEDRSNMPPEFELLIYQHKGNTIFETVYYKEKIIDTAKKRVYV